MLGGRQAAGLAQRLLGQADIDIAQVFIGGGIAGVGPHGILQRAAGFFQLVVLGVEHGQVVVGLGQFGVFLHQFLECRRGFVALAGVHLRHTLQKAPLRVTRGLLDLGLQLLQGQCGLAGLDQLFHGRVFVRIGGAAAQGKRQQGGTGHQGGEKATD